MNDCDDKSRSESQGSNATSSTVSKQRTISVLHIEDDIHDVELARDAVSTKLGGCNWVAVRTREQVESALKEQQFDVVLTDDERGNGFTGLDALELARARDPFIPLIVLSRTISEERAAEVFRHGATDFVLKDKLYLLAPALRRASAVARERKHTADVERALRGSEQRFRTLFEASPIAIAVVRPEGILFANRAAANLLGYEHPDDLAGMSPSSIAVSTVREPIGDAIEEWFASSESSGRYEILGRQRNGGELPLQLNVSRLELLDGPAAAAFFVDLGDIRAAEQEKEQLREQLHHSQKLEAVGQLAGGIAHDFNNMLSIILSYAAFMLEELDLDDPFRSDVAEINKAAERAEGIARQLLVFSRQERTMPRVIDVSRSVDDLAKMLGRLVGEHIEVIVELPDDLHRIRIDPGHFDQAVTNLVVNARDAMPRGGKLILRGRNVALDEAMMRVKPGLEPGAHVVVEVTDTGTGITQDARRHLFEPFFTTKEKGRGTGLGLAVVHGVVTSAGGFVDVSSKTSVGTTFALWFPKAKVADTERTVSSTHSLVLGQGEVILIVEDDDAVRHTASRILSRSGYNVIEAITGAMALERVAEGGVDLVLSDVVMPGLSGIDIYTRLRTERPELPVVLISGYPDQTLALHGLSLDDLTIIRKPFVSKVLLNALRDALDGKG